MIISRKRLLASLTRRRDQGFTPIGVDWFDESEAFPGTTLAICGATDPQHSKKKRRCQMS